MEQILLGGTFRLVHKLGEGGFGMVYKVVDSQTGLYYAAKMEKISEKRLECLETEIKIIESLAGTEGIFKIYGQGEEKTYRWMIVDLLGPSVDKLMRGREDVLTERTVVMLALQMISRLEALHSKGYVHRDIKPENFVMGIGNKSNFVYLVDFGLCKMYVDPRSKQQVPLVQGSEFVGTTKFASVASHKGLTQYRKDDMESLGYLLILLLKGVLPWSEIKSKAKDEFFHEIYLSKRDTTLESLCEGLSQEFLEYMSSVRQMKPHDKPHYNQFRLLFRRLFKRKNYVQQFQWVQADKRVINNLFQQKPVRQQR